MHIISLKIFYNPSGSPHGHLNGWMNFILFGTQQCLTKHFFWLFSFLFFPLKAAVSLVPIFSNLPNLYILTLEFLSSKIEYILHVCIKITHF